MKYIMIQHSWFVNSKGFDVEEIEAESKKHAHQIAKAKTFDKDSSFNKCRYTLLELEEEEVLKDLYNHKLNKIPRFIRRIFKA
mgnify:CR=1 FL=1